MDVLLCPSCWTALPGARTWTVGGCDPVATRGSRTPPSPSRPSLIIHIRIGSQDLYIYTSHLYRMPRRSSTGELVPKDISEILAREAKAHRGQRKQAGSLGQAFCWLKGSRKKKTGHGNGLNGAGTTATTADAKVEGQNHSPVKGEWSGHITPTPRVCLSGPLLVMVLSPCLDGPVSSHGLEDCNPQCHSERMEQSP